VCTIDRRPHQQHLRHHTRPVETACGATALGRESCFPSVTMNVIGILWTAYHVRWVTIIEYDSNCTQSRMINTALLLAAHACAACRLRLLCSSSGRPPATAHKAPSQPSGGAHLPAGCCGRAAQPAVPAAWWPLQQLVDGIQQAVQHEHLPCTQHPQASARRNSSRTAPPSPSQWLRAHVTALPVRSASSQ
jgi:hypothetical protein